MSRFLKKGMTTYWLIAIVLSMKNMFTQILLNHSMVLSSISLQGACSFHGSIVGSNFTCSYHKCILELAAFQLPDVLFIFP